MPLHRLLFLAVVVQCKPQQKALSPPPKLHIIGAGNSSASPTYGSSVDLFFECSQGLCPPWIRIDRTDGVADTSPFVRVIDEATPNMLALFVVLVPLSLLTSLVHSQLFGLFNEDVGAFLGSTHVDDRDRARCVADNNRRRMERPR